MPMGNIPHPVLFYNIDLISFLKSNFAISLTY